MKRLYIGLSLVAVLLISACGSSSANSDVEMRSINDAKGKVEIPVNPKRIVDLSGNSDILSIIGYKVAGTANSDAYDYTKYPSYLEDTLKGSKILGYSMQDTVDIEAVMSVDPDLIIISSVQEKMYDQLKEIAPTVMLENAALNWKDDITNIAKIFDKEKEANTWLSDYDAKAKEVAASIKETYGEDTSYLAFLASGGQFYIFSGAGFGSVLYEDLSLAIPEGMPEQVDISLPVVSYEGLAAIKADYIFLIGTDEDIKDVQNNSIWKGLDAVKNDHIVVLPSSPYFNQGYSSIGRKLLLDELPGMLDGKK